MEKAPQPRIGLSVAMPVRAAAEQLAIALTQNGFLVERIPIDEVGGSHFELALRSAGLNGIVDLALSDLLVELNNAGISNRLTTAAAMGQPLIIVPGGCDVWSMNAGERPVTLKEIERLAKDVAQKASASRGPVSILVPMESWSDGKPLNSDVARVFVECVRLWLSPAVHLHTITATLGSPQFAQRTADELKCLISAGPVERHSASC